MIRKNLKLLVATAAVGAVAVAGVASAAVNVSDQGVGFVGKGDVQLTFNWNNKALQDNATKVQFRIKSEQVTEVSWECTNANNGKVQERERTTTTSIEGIVSSIARERNQITGFNLSGLDGTSTSGTPVTEGPKLNSCPDANSTYTLTSPAGEPTVVSSTGGLQVSGDSGSTWVALPNTPVVAPV